MAKHTRTLSDDDVEFLRYWIDRQRGLHRPISLDDSPVIPSMAPECYVALTPAGGIPARSGTTLGTATCAIYEMRTVSSVVTLVDLTFTETVYNLSSVAADPSIYIVISREKFGYWVVDCA